MGEHLYLYQYLHLYAIVIGHCNMQVKKLVICF